MSVRRIAARAAVRDKQAKQNRTGRFALLILSAGTVSGIASMLGVWPFGSVQLLVKQIIQGPPSGPIEARSIFPPVQPVHQVINVYDPPPPAAPAPAPPPAAPPVVPPVAKPSPQPPQASPTPRPHPSPTPPVQSTPSPTPSPGGGD